MSGIDLHARACIACRKGTAALSQAEAAGLLAELPGWTMRDGSWIERDFRFADFATGFAFVQKVAAIAEAAGHHPDIAFGWGYVRLSLQTHIIGGLHENDFIVAARCERAV